MECDPSDYAHAPAGRLELVAPSRESRRAFATPAPARQRRVRACELCASALHAKRSDVLCAGCRANNRPPGRCEDCGEPTASLQHAFCDGHRAERKRRMTWARKRRQLERMGCAKGAGKHHVPSRVICIRGICRTPSGWAQQMGLRPNTLIQRIRRTSIFEALQGVV